MAGAPRHTRAPLQWDGVDVSDLLRKSLLQLSTMTSVRDAIERAAISRGVARRFVAGAETADAVRVSDELARVGRGVSIGYLGGETTSLEHAQQTKAAYLAVVGELAANGYIGHGRAEVSVPLPALGLGLDDGRRVALEHAREICRAAADAGAVVTVDMPDHTMTDATLHVVHDLRQDFPDTGVALQTCLHRTEADCRELSYAGSRVRLCKGAYREPGSAAYQDRADVDKAYVRCLKVLMAGAGYPMVASHDLRLVEIAAALAGKHGRDPKSFEYQMRYGIRIDEQQRIADRGDQMRVYVPFGSEWYGYLMRRLAERPANAALFLRSLLVRS